MRHQLGLERPVMTQYASWLGNAVQGDLGNELDGYPVSDYVTA
ncbi:glutathione ABC transporter permease GsiC, partial [Rhizobium ruizarguesonis]